jgi:hypothetical protein
MYANIVIVDTRYPLLTPAVELYAETINYTLRLSNVMMEILSVEMDAAPLAKFSMALVVPHNTLISLKLTLSVSTVEPSVLICYGLVKYKALTNSNSFSSSTNR